MRRLCLLLVLSIALSGCHLFVDSRIKESAAIDYAAVVVTVQKIDAGTFPPEAALEVLRALEPSMGYRCDYFEGRKPEVE